MEPYSIYSFSLTSLAQHNGFEIYPAFFFFFKETGPPMLPELALNSWTQVILLPKLPK